jgi:hypothetical protein
MACVRRPARSCSASCRMIESVFTQKAVLGFHAAWRPGFFGFEIINDPATRTLWNIYPVPIRQWINRNGGLGLATIYLSGPELLSMYRQCR